MIIVNAEAVEATAATLSAAEALEILAPAGPALTNEEAAALRQIVAAVATRDPATAQRLAAKKPPPPPPPPQQNGSAASDLKTFLETADLGRYADALVAAGCASVARLKAMPQEELKNLKDPRTGGRVLAVGALARLRRKLNEADAPPAPPPPPPSGTTPEPALTRHLADLGLDRFAPALARAGISTVEHLLDVDPKDLRNLVDPETNQKVLAVGPYSKLRASLEKLREQAPPPPPPPPPAPVVSRFEPASSLSTTRRWRLPRFIPFSATTRAARAGASMAWRTTWALRAGASTAKRRPRDARVENAQARGPRRLLKFSRRGRPRPRRRTFKKVRHLDSAAAAGHAGRGAESGRRSADRVARASCGPFVEAAGRAAGAGFRK